MSSRLVVLVPVLGRPHRVEPTLRVFQRATPGCRVLFIADPDDAEEIEALEENGAEYIAPGGNYASKIRAGVEATAEDLIFTGADDLEPYAGWFTAAHHPMIFDGAEVVGVNDLIDRDREHATHFLMRRGYAERPCIDGSPGPFFEGYHHWYCDNELIATAQRRAVYAYAETSRVLHLHPIAGLGEDDATYQRGSLKTRQDRRKFKQRSHLWRD